MKPSRRAFLAIVSAFTASGVMRAASAQAFKAATAEDLRRTLSNPSETERIIAGTVALRTLLRFEVSRKGPNEDGLWREHSAALGQLFDRVRNPDVQANVLRRLNTPSERTPIELIAKAVLPHIERMEKLLANGGLQPGSPLSLDLLNSFSQVNLYLELAGNSGWYCKIYPISVICSK